MLEEVLLSLTLNSLRGQHGEANSKNACTGFIETKEYVSRIYFSRTTSMELVDLCILGSKQWDFHSVTLYSFISTRIDCQIQITDISLFIRTMFYSCIYQFIFLFSVLVIMVLIALCFLFSFRVCQGAYDVGLVSAWEDWDAKHGSENDHPKEFSEEQVFIF